MTLERMEGQARGPCRHRPAVATNADDDDSDDNGVVIPQASPQQRRVVLLPLQNKLDRKP